MPVSYAKPPPNTTEPPIEKVLGRLDDVRKTGTGWQARCPAHDDRAASLSIGLGKDGETVLAKCHAGCDIGDVLQRIDLEKRDLFPRHLHANPNGSKPKRTIAAEYDYRKDGRLVFQVVRYEPKGFSQRRPDGNGGWIYNLQNIEPCLYHHDEIVASDDMTLLVEGEKDADRLRDLGLIATTCPMGAEKWRPQYTATLANRDVVILPDNDKPGRKHAQDVAQQLHAAGCTVTVVELPGLEAKQDVSDWLGLGFTVEDLVELIREVPVWEPETPPPDSHHDGSDDPRPGPGPIFITADDLMRKVFPDPRWAVEGIVPEGLTMYGGPPKIGKSWFMLNVACGIALGGHVVGKIPVDEGDVLYLSLEDTQRRLQDRLRTTLQGAPAPRRLTITTEFPTMENGAMAHIGNWLATHPDARLVVVDTFQKLRGPAVNNQNLYASDYAAAGELKRVADAYGVALVCIHHTRKAWAEDPIDMLSGSNGLAGAADTICILRKEVGKADATLYLRGRDVSEANHALNFDPDTCSWKLLGDAAEYRMSEERRSIINLLRDAPAPMSPKLIAEALGKKDGAIRKMLHMMAKAGEVDGVGGAYRLPIPPGNSGNTGNSPDHYTQTVTNVTGVTAIQGADNVDGEAGADGWTR